MPDVASVIGATAGLLGALALIFRIFHLPELWRGTLTLVRDWNGDKPRPGYAGRPSFPERMTKVEERTAALNHDMRDDLGGRLSLLEQQLDGVVEATNQLKRNGGSHLADQVHDIVEALATLKDQADRLEGFATDNREGIGRLDERVTGIEGRYEADARTSRDLEQYLATERKDLVVRAAALEASVNELLMVEGREQRELRPDELPDL